MEIKECLCYKSGEMIEPRILKMFHDEIETEINEPVVISHDVFQYIESYSLDDLEHVVSLINQAIEQKMHPNYFHQDCIRYLCDIFNKLYLDVDNFQDDSAFLVILPLLEFAATADDNVCANLIENGVFNSFFDTYKLFPKDKNASSRHKYHRIVHHEVIKGVLSVFNNLTKEKPETIGKMFEIIDILFIFSYVIISSRYETDFIKDDEIDKLLVKHREVVNESINITINLSKYVGEKGMKQVYFHTLCMLENMMENNLEDVLEDKIILLNSLNIILETIDDLSIFQNSNFYRIICNQIPLQPLCEESAVLFRPIVTDCLRILSSLMNKQVGDIHQNLMSLYLPAQTTLFEIPIHIYGERAIKEFFNLCSRIFEGISIFQVRSMGKKLFIDAKAKIFNISSQLVSFAIPYLTQSVEILEGEVSFPLAEAAHSMICSLICICDSEILGQIVPNVRDNFITMLDLFPSCQFDVAFKLARALQILISNITVNYPEWDIIKDLLDHKYVFDEVEESFLGKNSDFDQCFDMLKLSAFHE